MTREEKLQEKQREHRALLNKIEVLQQQKKPIENKLRKLNSKLKSVGQAIYDLKHEGDTPEVTDHAIVRYLERVEKVDIQELKLKVMSDKNAHKEGNVIVTVYSEDYNND